MQENNDLAPTTNQTAPLPPNEPTTPTPPTQLSSSAGALPVKSTATQIVWQFLCYVLWSWALIALSVLLSATLKYYLTDSSGSYEFIIYTLATMLCLVPLAFFSDKMYAKQEPEHKHGFAAVVMVLNAVFVFVAALGGLITMVVTILSLLVNPGDTSTKQVVITSSFVVAILGSMLFARILNPPRLNKFTKLFRLVVVVIASIAVILAVAGPFRAEIASRNDKLIEDNLPKLNNVIQDYAVYNNRLPKDLGELSFTRQQSDAKILVDKKLVEYRTLDAPASRRVDKNPPISDALTIATNGDVYYELCVNYKKERGNGLDRPASYDNYKSYLSTYSHAAGRVCYKQRTAPYGDL